MITRATSFPAWTQGPALHRANGVQRLTLRNSNFGLNGRAIYPVPSVILSMDRLKPRLVNACLASSLSLDRPCLSLAGSALAISVAVMSSPRPQILGLVGCGIWGRAILRDL